MTSDPRTLAIEDILKTFRLPDGSSVLDRKMVSSIALDRDTATVVVNVPNEAQARALERQREDAQSLISKLTGISSARVIMTTDQADASPDGPRADGPSGLTQVKHVLAVASGKGGVGKSTIATNLAAALAAQGLAVGLLDADIHGPSIQLMLGLEGAPDVDGPSIKPMEAHGLKAATMGSIVDPDTSMVWRGPMVVTALLQLANDVDWGALDILVIDMPPGTGDVQLTVAQRMNVSGALIVSTPQDVALQDVRKGVDMFRKVNVPIIGLVENMSYYTCRSCGDVAHLFGHGGAKQTADELEVPFLGEIPLNVAIREAGDAGTPAAVAQGTPHYEIFSALAHRVMEKVDIST